ncbi:hypothetical protein [Clavibacter michiganensis]|uniref:hypothetical protein n=1 Tax=Clavibacter michiganensis TaxID=28447 RepID=UPI0013665577|nr:hypothetical protein [Clavibacter michiganensis]MWJ49038.1 hypothetical protein [Clavibacter michiganensis subsp. michiganensis]
MTDSSATIYVRVDEEYPAFEIVDAPDPMTETVDVDAGTRARWQRVLSEYADVREEIAAAITAATGVTYPGLD